MGFATGNREKTAGAGACAGWSPIRATALDLDLVARLKCPRSAPPTSLLIPLDRLCDRNYSCETEAWQKLQMRLLILNSGCFTSFDRHHQVCRN